CVGVSIALSATCASRGGAKPPQDRPFDGIDLLPVLTGQQSQQPRTLCWRIDRAGRQQKAVRHGDWKYIQDGNVEMLFDLSHDISERHDLAFAHPEVFADLKR